MNKRIKKKRAQTSPLKIGDHVYSREYIRDINRANIGFMNCVALYRHIKDPKISRPRIRSLINYIYKNRETHLKPKDKFIFQKPVMISERRTIITGGKPIKHGSSAYIRFTEEDKHE